MHITTLQKLKIFPLLVLIKLFIFLEHFGEVIRLFFYILFKSAVLIFIFIVLFRSFPISVVESDFYRYSPFSVFSPYITTPSPELPRLVNKLSLPELSARSFGVFDAKSGRVLSEKDITQRLAPASTTKLVTALVALDLYRLSDILLVPGFCTTVEGSKLGLLPNERVLVQDLFYGLLVNSSNDVACVFANSKVPSFKFVDLMNQKVEEFGLTDTHFTNPVGLDGVIGSHYSSVQDLYVIAKVATEVPFIKRIVRTKEYTVSSGSVPRKIYTTNYLLWAIPESVGIKTGRTEAAGEVLIYEFEDDLRDLIIVVMGSDNRFLDTRLLLDWTLATYSWES